MLRRTVRRARGRWRRIGLISASLGAIGCRWLEPGSPAPLHPVPAAESRTIALGDGVPTDSVELIAMGLDGFLVMPWSDTTRLVMTPPAYSHPSLWHLLLRDWWWGTRPNLQRIDRALATMPAVTPTRLGNVRAVLVGHGHYDHVMDLPPLRPRLPAAQIFGSATVVHELRPAFPPFADARPPLVDVTAQVGSDGAHPGRDLVVAPRVRVRPIAWGHAPNVPGFTIASGRYARDLARLPRTVHGWKLGEPLAWTVDILGRDGAVALRLFHHDAAADLAIVRRALDVMAAMPPARRTVVIMTAANWDQATGYPGALLATLQPDLVVFGHWEDFFRSPALAPKVVRGIDGGELVAAVEHYVGTRWRVLEPGATLRLTFP